ncbi:MAG TPA: NAD(P)H-dependent glycerol-3-phosphate dehydrogenase, partial [Chromatiaceae bacterium]|nr:NAD(P)H-dependent glycerol-3-phosphate dehydrogenase [Chromatiaceae bacterium]
MAPIAVLGAGSWGTALALVVARNGYPVRLWDHWPAQVADLIRDRENRRFLPGFPLPDNLEPVLELRQALEGAAEILVVVPSHGFAALLRALPPLGPDVGLAWATKGLEPGTTRLLHEVAMDVLGPRDVAVVSGPSFAAEVARGLPTAVTVASPQLEQARRVAAYLHGERFRAYTSDDIIGVQVGGAAKNVLAIA